MTIMLMTRNMMGAIALKSKSPIVLELSLRTMLKRPETVLNIYIGDI